MNIVLFGPPGAGKGTQSKMIEDTFGLKPISTGELARITACEGGDLGELVTSYIDKGNLLPDDLIMDMLVKYIQLNNHAKGFIFDGVPRTLSQAELMNNILVQMNISIDFVLNIKVSEDVILNRLSNRLVCTACKSNFNKLEHVDMICVCGKKLVIRDDDKNPELIKHRFLQYKNNLLPILNFYSNSRDVSLFSISGDDDIEIVYSKIQEILISKK